jgi:hypothetical protein
MKNRAHEGMKIAMDNFGALSMHLCAIEFKEFL